MTNQKTIDPSIAVENYITFTAPKTGEYVFYSQDSRNIISGSVCDIYGRKLFENSGINFRVECVLEEGDTYSLETTFGTGESPVTIGIDCVGEAKEIKISDSNGYETEYIYGSAGGSKHLFANFFPRNGAIEDVTWSSDDSDIASVDEAIS